ncbi:MULTISPECIES: hypothetical protein [Actinokineospora]|uniref:Uncharacterized protein n=1 Tax=Actinokineospora fastidiosa TaxID=1816 RepID=A0A918GFY8_9PSEU|nr:MULTISPECIES: hypothetical protein [Actinokineospora]UVS80119.1 hypothetical protein Actkin_03869 [Actinokineospora sp. UTMC 2448]GGS33185.1 hypothetical protein GCM10010171_29150 [Actinokineospora fastidiosa]
MATETEKPSPTAVKAATAFVGAHGKPARAVAENVGLAGVRVVLVGADGALGDVMVASMAAADALVERVDGLEAAEEWDRETVAATRIGAGHRAKMAARTRG